MCTLRLHSVIPRFSHDFDVFVGPPDALSRHLGGEWWDSALGGRSLAVTSGPALPQRVRARLRRCPVPVPGSVADTLGTPAGDPPSGIVRLRGHCHAPRPETAEAGTTEGSPGVGACVCCRGPVGHRDRGGHEVDGSTSDRVILSGLPQGLEAGPLLALCVPPQDSAVWSPHTCAHADPCCPVPPASPPLPVPGPSSCPSGSLLPTVKNHWPSCAPLWR